MKTDTASQRTVTAELDRNLSVNAAIVDVDLEDGIETVAAHAATGAGQRQSARTARRETRVDDAPVFVYRTHGEAEEAVGLLMKSGFDADQLSILGKRYHGGQHPVGFYFYTSDRVSSSGRAGPPWSGIWSLLFAPAVFFLPGVGLVAVAGPFVSMLVGVLEGGVPTAGVSAIGVALIAVGVLRDQVVAYENALTGDSDVLIVHRPAAEAH